MARGLALRRKVARSYLTDSKGIGRNVARDGRGLGDSSKKVKERGDLDHYNIKSYTELKEKKIRNSKATRPYSKFRELRSPITKLPLNALPMHLGSLSQASKLAYRVS